MGFQGSVEYFFVPNKISLSLGVRYRSSAKDQVLTGSDTLYRENDTDASDLAILIDSYFFTMPFGPISMRLGAGVDYDMSTINFKATEIDTTAGTSTEEFTATSELSVIALRLLVDTRYDLDMFSLGFGLDLELPLMENGPTISSSGDEAEQEEFTTALGHTKSGFAVGITIDAAIQF